MFARAEVVFTVIWQGVLFCILFFLLGYMYPENGDTRGFSCCKIMSFFKDAGWWCYAAAAMSQFSIEGDMAKFWILFFVVVHVFPRSSALVGFLADFAWLTWCHLVACWVMGMIFSSVSSSHGRRWIIFKLRDHHLRRALSKSGLLSLLSEGGYVGAWRSW